MNRDFFSPKSENVGEYLNKNYYFCLWCSERSKPFRFAIYRLLIRTGLKLTPGKVRERMCGYIFLEIYNFEDWVQPQNKNEGERRRTCLHLVLDRETMKKYAWENSHDKVSEATLMYMKGLSEMSRNQLTPFASLFKILFEYRCSFVCFLRHFPLPFDDY